MSEGPPTDSPPDITSSISGRRYPDTPMPNYPEDEDEEFEDSASDIPPRNSLFDNAIQVLFIAIAIAHLWTVWTLRADMNIMMQFQKELGQQNKHITDLLHNQHQVKWQIVPSQP